MNIEERFLKYISFDTQSDPQSNATPSTEKQLELAKFLVDEMNHIGISDVELDEYGIVYGTIKSNGGTQDIIGFIAHMDTSSDFSGKDVNPQVIRQYDGCSICLNNNLNLYLDPKEFPLLKDVVGHDLITTDGTTLLGADDKAGIAIIMSMAQYLLEHPEIKHNDIKIAFTPDEEVGRGADNFNVEKFGAKYAYTVDGGDINEVCYENFNAFGATVEITGKSIHPGDSKNKMINSILVAYEFENMLPIFNKPQFTDGYEGFNHLHHINGGCEYTKMEYILRNHNRELLDKQIKEFNDIVNYLNEKYGYEICKVSFKEQYLNMYEIIKDNMDIVTNVTNAMKKLNMNPINAPIRGGTDGSRLTFMGLPCPNLGTGGYNFHGKYEYVSLTMMKQGVSLLIELVKE